MIRVEIKQLIWDGWNVGHIGKHKVKVNEVEEVCSLAAEALESHKGRIIVLGQTKNKKLLTIVLAPEGREKYYVVTARDMSQKEKGVLLK